MDEGCVRFCSNCTMIPKGVVAKLTEVATTTWSDLRRYRFAHEAPEFARGMEGMVTLQAEVVESEDPSIPVGSDARMHLVRERGLDFDSAARLIRDCRGPVSTNILQRLLGIRPRCGAFDNRSLKNLR